MSSSKGHRQVAFLKQVIAAGSTIAKASFSIERGLGRTNPTYLLTLDQHGALTLQELPWTPELEEYLLHERPTQMDDRADERERFANLLGNNLKVIEAQFGRASQSIMSPRKYVDYLNADRLTVASVFEEFTPTGRPRRHRSRLTPRC